MVKKKEFNDQEKEKEAEKEKENEKIDITVMKMSSKITNTALYEMIINQSFFPSVISRFQSDHFGF